MWGVCVAGGMCAWQRACMVGEHMHSRRACVAACPSVNRMTDRCKTLPCRNLVAGGNNTCLKVLRNVWKCIFHSQNAWTFGVFKVRTRPLVDSKVASLGVQTLYIFFSYLKYTNKITTTYKKGVTKFTEDFHPQPSRTPRCTIKLTPRSQR